MFAKVIVWMTLLLMLAGAACADPPPPLTSDPISIDPLSPSVTGGWNLPADIYGEAGGPIGQGWDVVGGVGPILHIPFFAYGLVPPDDNDAHSLGHNNPNWIPIVYFSADRRSIGAWNTQYRHQALRNQAAGDRFVTNGWMNLSPAASYGLGVPANLVVWIPGWGPNLLSANQTRYNEIPSIPQGVFNPNTDPRKIDDMDALELHAMDLDGDHKHDQWLFFSLSPTSPSLPAANSPADIFVSPPGGAVFWLWATAGSMGLAASDDIDALVVFHVSGAQVAIPGVDYALFSLRPGNSIGASPSEIYVTCFQGISKVYINPWTIGLRTVDDLDGLDIEPYVEGQTFPQVWDEIEDPPANPPGPMYPQRSHPDGTMVNVSGIVTLLGPDFLYIEEPDRSSGIRVQGVPPWFVAVGDDLQVIGALGMFQGERVINPSPLYPVSPITSGNPVPDPFDMRSRAVGGDAYDAVNPGVTDGRGALNVGLRVRLQGMVTAVDAAGGNWFYVWDGANRVSAPLDDGSGNYGVRIEGASLGATWIDWVSVDGVVSATDQPVAGRVIPMIRPISVSVATVFDAITAASGTALRANWNLIGLPAAPANIGIGVPPQKYVYEAPWEAQQVLAPTKQYSEVDGRVTRHENSNQGIYIFDEWSEPLGAFGGMLIGDGYWVQLDRAWAVNYSGKLSSLDQWYSIKSAGTPLAPKWILCGHPKDHYTYWDDAKMHDGAQIVDMETASTRNLGWIETSGLWFDNTVQGLKDIGVTEDYPATQTLRPWHGYWFKVYSAGKSIIFPESPVAPPPP